MCLKDLKVINFYGRILFIYPSQKLIVFFDEYKS